MTDLQNHIFQRIPYGVCGLALGFVLISASRVPAQNGDHRRDAVSERIFEKNPTDFSVELKHDRLVISIAHQPVAEFVFDDPQILRPYFTRLKTLSGHQVTRNHPPIVGQDPGDHETMHPGIWLAFGDINDSDFWRNKARVKHTSFTEQPSAGEHGLTFATEAELISADQITLGRLLSRFRCQAKTDRWLLVWDALFVPTIDELVFGDQEEMGFGVRVATPISEKKGGTITNSLGKTTAKATWGQPAQWCDYSGVQAGEAVGVTLMADPKNFRESWWHNRDYGILVANPFGRAAMKQGEPSRVAIARSQELRIVFGAMIHHGNNYNPTQGYADFLDARSDAH